MNTYTVYFTDKSCVVINAKSLKTAKKLAIKKIGLPVLLIRNYGP